MVAAGAALVLYENKIDDGPLRNCLEKPLLLSRVAVPRNQICAPCGKVAVIQRPFRICGHYIHGCNAPASMIKLAMCILLRTVSVFPDFRRFNASYEDFSAGRRAGVGMCFVGGRADLQGVDSAL